MRPSTSSLAWLALLAAPLASAEPLLGLGHIGKTNTNTDPGVQLLQLNTTKLLQSISKSLNHLLDGNVLAQVDAGTNTNQVLDSVTDTLDKILKRGEEAQAEKRAAPVAGSAAPAKMVKLKKRSAVGDADRLIDSAHAEKKRQLDHHAQERANLATRRAGKRRLAGEHHGVAQDHPDLARRALGLNGLFDKVNKVVVDTTQGTNGIVYTAEDTVGKDVKTVEDVLTGTLQARAITLNELFNKVNKVITDTTHGTNSIVYTAEGTVGADVKHVEDIVTGTLQTREIPEKDKVFVKRVYSKTDLLNAVNKILTDTTGAANNIVGTTEVTVGSDVLTVEQILEGLTSTKK